MKLVWQTRRRTSTNWVKPRESRHDLPLTQRVSRDRGGKPPTPPGSERGGGVGVSGRGSATNRSGIAENDRPPIRLRFATSYVCDAAMIGGGTPLYPPCCPTTHAVSGVTGPQGRTPQGGARPRAPRAKGRTARYAIALAAFRARSVSTLS